MDPATVKVEFYGGPFDGADSEIPAWVRRMKVPHGKVAVLYEWANRSNAAGWVMNFVGWIDPTTPVKFSNPNIKT